jgi:hypothetical protein
MTHASLGRTPDSSTPSTDLEAIWERPAAESDARRLAEETAALRREAADILRRSRSYRDECLREVLLRRRWYGAGPPAGGATA